MQSASYAAIVLSTTGARLPVAFLAIALAAVEGWGSPPEARPWGEPYFTYAYLRKSWETSGREWIRYYSGLRWDQDEGKWEPDPEWRSGTEAALQAYYIEYTTEGAVNMAVLCHDLRLLDELAELHTAYLETRFTTLGAMRRRASSSLASALLDNQGDDSVRTLLWIEQGTDGDRIRECLLCNSQFFHPASRLIRAISLLPESQRTFSMRSFARSYTPLIVREHLIRFLYEAEIDHYYGASDLPRRPLVDIWRTLLTTSLRPRLSQQHAMFDWDLWLVATAAEILGANATDPKLVPLKPDERARLQRAVQTGVSLLQKKKTIYPGTRNFRGAVVGSASYFNGDFDDHEEMAYSGYTGRSFPTPNQKSVHRGVSWDSSHISRLPIFLRSLYDNKKAAGADFPSAHDIELVTNQYMYKVFRGDLNRPSFNNFFDGSSGWFEVGYHGPKFGYPPAQYCDARSEAEPCLIVGEVSGWGLIASFNPDLMDLEHSLLKLAWKEDAATRAFKDRYYYYDKQDFSFRDSQGKLQYPILLFWILSGVPEKLQGCGSQ